MGSYGSPANSYFNNPTKAGLPALKKESPDHDYKNISKYSVNKRMMGSGERNRSLPSGKGSSKYAQMSSHNGAMGNNTNSYGIYAGSGLGNSGLTKGGGGLVKGGLSKNIRKDSSKGDKPPTYGGYNNYGGYGGGGGGLLSKYRKKSTDSDEEHFPSVTNRQALGSGISIGSRRNIGSNVGSKEGSRGRVGVGGHSGIGGLGGGGGLSGYHPPNKNDSNKGLPNLSKYSNSGGLGKVGGLSKGLNKGGLNLDSGLSKGGLGRYNL